MPAWWRWHYPRPAGAHVGGTAAVDWLQGPRDQQRERERRAKRLAEQRERQRATGFAGGNAELGHVAAFEASRLGYAPRVAQYIGHLCSVGTEWNFQGQIRLAQLMDCSVRSVQRYRARLEDDGLIKSYVLLPGDMVEGQRAPVRRPHVVRNIAPLRRIALACMPARQSPTPRRDPRSGTGRDRAGRRPAVLPPLQTMSAEELPSVAAGAEPWLRASILGTQPKAPPPAPLSDAQLDDLDAELRELSERQHAARQRMEEREQRARGRPPDPPQRE